MHLVVVVVGMGVLDHDELARPRSAIPPPSSGVDEQHPAAPERRSAPGAHGGPDHPDRQHDEADADEPLHDEVDRFGEPLGEQDRHRAQHHHHRRVAQRVERRQPHRAPRLRLRARQVGQGRDVVPVEAVTEPEHDGRDEDRRRDQIDHEAPHRDGPGGPFASTSVRPPRTRPPSRVRGRSRSPDREVAPAIG